MFFGRFHYGVYWLLKSVGRISLAAVCIVLVIQLVPPVGNAWIDKSQEWIVKNQKMVNVVLVGLVTACGALAKWVGNPWVLDCVKDILESFQREVFNGIAIGELSDHHRVTLYRYQRICLWPGWRGSLTVWWPWGWGNWPHSGWLVPVVRAGPDSRATTIFLAKDATHFEGICGAVHFSQHANLEMPPPKLPCITPNSSDADISAYAAQTFVSEEMIRRRIRCNRPCAQYFYAARVEVQSSKWGVLMIDSRAEAPPKPQVTQQWFRLTNKVLTHLLKRA